MAGLGDANGDIDRVLQVADRGRADDDRAPASSEFDESVVAQSLVGVQDGMDIEPERFGEVSRGWQSCPLRRLAGGDVSRLVVWSSVGSRSSAIFDLDDDGDLDIVTNEFHAPPQVLINDRAQRRDPVRFLKIQLRGSASNRDGRGAKVQVHSAGRTLMKVHDGKSGYMSQSSIPLYFGLGAADGVERIDVEWPSGRKQTVAGPIETNRLLELTEP